jgi:hypothetical protein
MADTTTIKWLYPPNFLGTYAAHGMNYGHRRHTIQCTCVSDGTGETDAIKLKRTDLLTPSGNIPSTLVPERIEYNITGMRVTIDWNSMTDEHIAVLEDSEGVLDFTGSGGMHPIDDGEGDAYSGDIVFTTAKATDGDSYNITMTIRAKD